MRYLRSTFEKLAIALIAIVVIGCNKTTNKRICYMGSTWEIGEVKSCTQDKLKGDDATVLWCGAEAGAAFYMTAGALETAKDEETRSKLRSLFHEKTKTFPVSFEGKPVIGENGEPLGMWECRKTDSKVECKLLI